MHKEERKKEMRTIRIKREGKNNKGKERGNRNEKIANLDEFIKACIRFVFERNSSR
jgi:hypothetical protein